MQAALERAMAELVFGPALERSDGPGFEAWLARSASNLETRRALERDFPRLLVYRRLVRRTLRSAVELAMPRAVARLGALFDAYFDRFLAEVGPRTHYLRDVTTEFLDFAEPLLRSDPRVPAFLCDLARHESLSIVVGASMEGKRTPFAELDLDRGLLFTEAACIARYEFAVHLLPDDEADRSEPPAEPTALFVYRSPEHDVRYLALTPLAADIVERLLSGETLRHAVLEATARHGTAPNAALLEATARVLADLAERGALLGAGTRTNAELKDVAQPPTMAGQEDTRDSE
jgi:hypothetical protein